MSMRRDYKLVAAVGLADELLAALRVLAGQVMPLAGNKGVEVWMDTQNPLTFTFVGRWLSIDAQKAVGALLAKSAFATIGSTLDSAQEGTSLTVVDQWTSGAG